MGLFNRIIDKMVSDKVPFKKRKRLIVFVAHNPSFNDNSNGCVVHGKYICRCGQA